VVDCSQHLTDSAGVESVAGSVQDGTDSAHVGPLLDRTVDQSAPLENRRDPLVLVVPVERASGSGLRERSRYTVGKKSCLKYKYVTNW
jgi:hypothetical protein